MMPVCSLFLHQQLALLPPSQYTSALALPDRAANPEVYNVAISSAGLGVRSVCAIPRMSSVGGYPGSAGNAANIAFCAVAVLVGVVLAIKAGKRQAAVARWEIRAFFIIFALENLFQIFSTGSFIRQNTASIVWVTAIQLGFVLLLFWTLAWSSFLTVQFIEDGTLASIIPYSLISLVLFIGFTYICLDTGFSVSGYFDSQPGVLHNNWIFTILIVLCAAFVLFSIVVSIWVSGMYLRERKPLFLYSGALLFFILSQGALWGLSQAVCIGSDSRVDGSFLSTLCTIISVIFFYYAWQSVTEDYWDEVTTERMSQYGSGSGSQMDRYSSIGNPLLPANQQQQQQQYGMGNSLQHGNSLRSSHGAGHGQYMQQTSPLQTTYPYSER